MTESKARTLAALAFTTMSGLLFGSIGLMLSLGFNPDGFFEGSLYSWFACAAAFLIPSAFYGVNQARN